MYLVFPVIVIAFLVDSKFNIKTDSVQCLDSSFNKRQLLFGPLFWFKRTVDSALAVVPLSQVNQNFLILVTHQGRKRTPSLGKYKTMVIFGTNSLDQPTPCFFFQLKETSLFHYIIR